MTTHAETVATGSLRTAEVAMLHRFLQIPSPSGEEAALAAEAVDTMRQRGYQAQVDDAGNAVGTIGTGNGPTVMMLGHIDTIEGQIPVHLTDGCLYGRGAVDAKAPFAAMVCAGAAAGPSFPGTITVVGVVEEETPGSRGAVAIRKTHEPPDALIVGEPSGWSTIVLGYKGKLDLRYEVTCPPTHPSNPVDKASELAARCWSTLLELLGPDSGHGSFDQPGATLVSITGDLVQAEAELSIRTPPGFDDYALVNALGRADPGRLSVVNSIAAVRTDRRDPVVRALSAAIRETGGAPTLKVKTATSDMNTLAQKWRVPMATYGPGDSRLDHADDERIEVAEYLRGIAVLVDALHRLGASGQLKGSDR
jgi:LysW-gamma-L-lysine carboxypeptidase